MGAGCAGTPPTDSAGANPAAAKGDGGASAAGQRVLPAALHEPAVPPAGEGWNPLLDGRSLAGWKVVEFGGHGEVSMAGGAVLIEMGAALSGMAVTNPVPRQNYEVVWDAMKVDGNDFFAAMTLPFGESYFTFVTGGWGGGVVGISSLDGLDASENESTKYAGFDKARWYRFKVEVTPQRIRGWIDEELTVNAEIGDRRVALRTGDIDLCIPLGIASWQTTGAVRGVWIRPLAPARQSEAPAAGPGTNVRS